MADNYVQIKIKASDEAKPDLTALRFDLDELGSKIETAKVDVDDKEAAAKLLDLNAKLVALDRRVANPKLNAAGAARAEAQIAALGIALDNLNDKHPSPKVVLEGAAKTLAEVAALDAELGHLNDKAANAGPGGLLGRIIGGAGNSLPSGGIAGTLLGPAGLAIVPALGAILVEVTGLVSGFAAAGAGAGAFAILAAPSVKQVTAAYTSLNAAQAKYQAAQAKEAADPTKANAAAVKAAALNLQLAQDALKKMPASEQGAISGIQQLVSHFSNMAQTLRPDVFKVFNAGLKLANELMPAILPFASTFAEVLTKLLGQAGKFAKSKGFQDWIGQFHGLEGPALSAIGAGIGKVVIAFGKLLTVMSGKDVSHAIAIAFDVVVAVLDAVTYAVRRVMQNWDGMSSTAARDSRQVATAFDNLRHDISAIFDSIRRTFASAGHDIAHDFDTIRHAAATWFHDLAAIFDAVRHAFAAFATGTVQDGGKVIAWFRALPGRIMGFLASLPGMMVRAGAHVIESLIQGIESGIGRLGSVVSGIAGKIAGFFGLSPAKEGPLSGGGAPWIRGQHLVQDIAGGMMSARPALAQAAQRIAGTAAPGHAGGYGLAAGGGGRIVLEVTGGGQSAYEQFLLQGIRNLVRVKGGGDAQKAFGRS